MKRLLWPLYFIGALVVAWLIYSQLPNYIKEGGWLVAGLIFLMIMVVTFVIERTISLRRAAGRGSLPAFLTILMMPLTYSVAQGLAFGFMSYTIIKFVAGKHKDNNPVTYALTILFALHFVLGG